jgi:hypothetical protein
MQMKFRQAVVIGTLAFSVAGCGVVDTMVHAIEYQKAAETDLEQMVGVKPGVGFNMKNSYLSVTVIFPDIRNPPKPLNELGDIVRDVITRDFKKAPDELVVGFAVGK